MPTPVDIFLTHERDGDEAHQLASSQEWDWKNGRFNGFVDREFYLRRVSHQLLVDSGRDVRSMPPAFISYEEQRRRMRLLTSLQRVLQSRRLKTKVVGDCYAALPIKVQQDEAWESSRHLNRVWWDPYGRAAFSLQSIWGTLRQDMLKSERQCSDAQLSSITGISNDPSHHIYPSANLQRMLYVARPLGNDSVFHCTIPSNERTRWTVYMKNKQAALDLVRDQGKTSCQYCIAGKCVACVDYTSTEAHRCATIFPQSPCVALQRRIQQILFEALIDAPQVRARCLRELSESLAVSQPASYFPKLKPTTSEGVRWAIENRSDGLRCQQRPPINSSL